MHRLLLYTLVGLLLCMAWNARRAQVLAAAAAGDVEGGAGPGSGETLLAADEGTAGAGLLEERLEARVEPRPDLWTELVDRDFGGQDLEGLPAEVVLGEAEQWVEERFPEGGTTAPGEDPLARQATGVGALRGAVELTLREPETSLAGDPREGDPARPQSGDANAPAGASTPFDAALSIAALARLEAFDGGGFGGDSSIWCGLLDIALADEAPPGPTAGGRGAALGALGYAESVWLSDERGRLIARVSSLHGLGFEVDPAWPWSPRARRLVWNGWGRLPIEARQLRLVLQGTGITPSWVGRLIFVPPAGAGGAHR